MPVLALAGHRSMPRLITVNRSDHIETENYDGRKFVIFLTTGHGEILKILLGSGATVGPKSRDGYSPLYLAAQNGNAKYSADKLHAKINVFPTQVIRKLLQYF